MGGTVIVLGKGELACQVAQWFHNSDVWDLTCVVPVIPEPDWSWSFNGWADTVGVPIVIGHDDAYRADLAVSVFYDRILSAAWIGRYGRVLNLHNAPLPRYRGVNPINWALKNRERQHGVTLHEVTPGVDDGPIVAQVTFPIWPDIDEVEDVYRRSLAFGWTLLEQTLPIIDHIEAVPQTGDPLIYYKTDAIMLGDRAGWRRP